jgi:hypothetical protein
MLGIAYVQCNLLSIHGWRFEDGLLLIILAVFCYQIRPWVS